MARRIGATPVRYPFSFVVVGDSGAWPDAGADAVLRRLLRRTARLRPAPLFLAHLGDFAGPGTRARHEHYLELVEALAIPNVCLIGNHDLEDGGAPEAWAAIHGPRNFQFAYGGTRFVAIDGASGQVGELDDTTPPDTAGPPRHGARVPEERARRRVGAAPGRVHARAAAPGRPLRPARRMRLPPGRAGVPRHHPPPPRRARVLRARAAFDHHVHDGTRYVMSGGGGSGLYASYPGVLGGAPAAADRAAVFHAVQITITDRGAVAGRVLEAFAPEDGAPRITF